MPIRHINCKYLVLYIFNLQPTINLMKATWIILLIMVVIGTGMYFLSKRKPKMADHDTIVFKSTPDSIIRKMKIYVAEDPTEVAYLDSAWITTSDSIPLKQIMNGTAQDTMSRQYAARTLYLTYDDHSFFDVELKKANPKMPYSIELKVQPQNNDSLFVDGLIRPTEGNAMHFAGPMMKLYSRFVLTYNYKLPKPPPDSLAIKGHDANKTVTILKN